MTIAPERPDIDELDFEPEPEQGLCLIDNPTIIFTDDRENRCRTVITEDTWNWVNSLPDKPYAYGETLQPEATEEESYVTLGLRDLAQVIVSGIQSVIDAVNSIPASGISGLVEYIEAMQEAERVSGESFDFLHSSRNYALWAALCNCSPSRGELLTG